MPHNTSRLKVYSHDLLPTGQATPRRWSLGYLAEPDPQPGCIRITRAVAAHICRDWQHLRREAIAAAADASEWYGDAVAEIDAVYPRLDLHGEHLVSDWRHVHGDSDYLRCTEPGSDGLYSIGLGFTWYPVQRNQCDQVRDEATGPSALILVSGQDLDEAVAAHHAGTDITWRADHGQHITIRPVHAADQPHHSGPSQ